MRFVNAVAVAECRKSTGGTYLPLELTTTCSRVTTFKELDTHHRSSQRSATHDVSANKAVSCPLISRVFLQPGSPFTIIFNLLTVLVVYQGYERVIVWSLRGNGQHVTISIDVERYGSWSVYSEYHSLVVKCITYFKAGSKAIRSISVLCPSSHCLLGCSYCLFSAWF